MRHLVSRGHDVHAIIFANTLCRTWHVRDCQRNHERKVQLLGQEMAQYFQGGEELYRRIVTEGSVKTTQYWSRWVLLYWSCLLGIYAIGCNHQIPVPFLLTHIATSTIHSSAQTSMAQTSNLTQASESASTTLFRMHRWCLWNNQNGTASKFGYPNMQIYWDVLDVFLASSTGVDGDWIQIYWERDYL